MSTERWMQNSFFTEPVDPVVVSTEATVRLLGLRDLNGGEYMLENCHAEFRCVVNVITPEDGWSDSTFGWYPDGSPILPNPNRKVVCITSLNDSKPTTLLFYCDEHGDWTSYRLSLKRTLGYYQILSRLTIASCKLLADTQDGAPNNCIPMKDLAKRKRLFDEIGVESETTRLIPADQYFNYKGQTFWSKQSDM